MKEVIVTKDPVLLEGFQSILKLSQYGKYNLAALLPDDVVEKLEAGREDELKYQKSRLKNPKRCTIKPEPWMEVSNGKTQAKFAWKEGKEPPIVDTEGHSSLMRTFLFILARRSSLRLRKLVTPSKTERLLALVLSSKVFKLSL